MMRRCARCVLPETFPGISFDSSGVCSVCHSHETKAEHGRDELERIIAPYRSRNGEADCIVAFSGGRDSSYGLHYIKRELGMNPIAYTYDWGMVTDLARRNISRLCAKLEVEHLLRSTDIRAKRRNIRKNIEAWLHRPELGMIPLFMAGGQAVFITMGRQTRKETGLPLVFFCGGNELERTEFKSGFCGVRESKHGQVLWKFSIRNKVQLAAYYAMQYLRNPRYFNVSFFDTLFASIRPMSPAMTFSISTTTFPGTRPRSLRRSATNMVGKMRPHSRIPGGLATEPLHSTTISTTRLQAFRSTIHSGAIRFAAV